VQPATAVRPIKPRVSSQTIIFGAIATVLFVVLIAAVAWALRSPTFTDEVRVVNDTAYSVNIDVVGEKGRIGLGTVPAGDEMQVIDVLDQGDTWTFEFSYADIEDAGEHSVSRSVLEANDWTIEVPGDVSDRLQREGIGPSAE
jgi:hypothetical protein